jgi:hypothetical protein
MCSKLVSAIIASLDKETIETGLYFWSFGRERLEISWLVSRSKWQMAVKHDPKMAEKFYRRKKKYPTHTHILLFIFSLDSFKIQAWLDCAFLTVLRFFFETLSRELLTLYWYRISYFSLFSFQIFISFPRGGLSIHLSLQWFLISLEKKKFIWI